MMFTIPLWMNPVPHQQGIKVGFKHGHAYTYKDENLAAFQQQFAMLLRSEINKTHFKRIEGDYEISCTFYFKDKRHGDPTNCWKTIEDACEGQLFTNDKNAGDIRLIRRYDKLNPRIELSILPANGV